MVNIEFPSKDLKKTSKVHAELFDWGISNFDELDFSMFNPGEGPGGGFPPIDNQINKMTAYWFTSRARILRAI